MSAFARQNAKQIKYETAVDRRSPFPKGVVANARPIRAGVYEVYVTDLMVGDSTSAPIRAVKSTRCLSPRSVDELHTIPQQLSGIPCPYVSEHVVHVRWPAGRRQGMSAVGATRNVGCWGDGGVVVTVVAGGSRNGRLRVLGALGSGPSVQRPVLRTSVT